MKFLKYNRENRCGCSLYAALPYRVEVGPEVGGEAVDEEAENVQAVLGHLGEGRGQAGVLDCHEGFT